MEEGSGNLLPSHHQPSSGPEYANLPLHYATLGRSPRPRPLPRGHTESIPDILQTLSNGLGGLQVSHQAGHQVNHQAGLQVNHQARVIVNELSDLEEKLVDLSPEDLGKKTKFSHSYISVKHSNMDDNI